MNKSSFDDRVSNLSKKDYTIIYDCLIDEVEKVIKEEFEGSKNKVALCMVKDAGDNEGDYCKIRFDDMSLVVARAFENVTKIMSSKTFEEMFKIDLYKAASVSINFDDEKAQEIRLNKLQTTIEKYLEEKITDEQLDKVVRSLDKYINEKARETNGATFNMKNAKKSVDVLDFKYDNKNVSKDEEYIRKDLLNVKFKGKMHKQSIKEAILNYYENQIEKYEELDDESKIIELEDIVRMTKESDFIVNDIHKFTYEQRNACLTRIGEYIYMDSLINSIDIKKLNQKDRDVFLKLKRYIGRFSEFENACTDILVNNKDVMFYIVDDRRPLSILNCLRAQSIYGGLPIIGEISSILGYAKDVNISEKYGMKLKQNGEVKNLSEIEELTGRRPNSSVSSFMYMMWKLKLLSEMSTEKECISDKLDEKRCATIAKSISHAMLLKFMLLGLSDENYDPKKVLLEDISRIKDAKTFSEAKKLLKEISLDIFRKANEIEVLLKEFVRVLETKIIKLSKNEIESAKKIHTYRRHLVMFKSILPDNVLSSELEKKMKEQMNTKNLKYTSLVDDEGLEKLKSHVLMSYTYDFTIESVFARFDKKNPVKISSEYINDGDLLNIQFYPSLYRYDKWLGKDSKTRKCLLMKAKLSDVDRNRLNSSMKNLVNEPQIMFPYIIEEKVHDDSIDAFIMNALYKTMLYVCIKSIVNLIERRKTIKYINIHTQFLSGIGLKYSNSNKFIHDCYKEVAFILGRKYITNSQGINVEKLDYKNMNYACSVYSNVKRKYTSDEYCSNKKLAILAITGQKVDSGKNRNNKNDNAEDAKNAKKDTISLILGELYIVEEKDGNMYVEKKKNIIDSTREDVYGQPSLILDVVNEIEAMGVREIVYLSSAPYQMKYEEEDEDVMKLYYFNESVIKMMSKDGNMRIYPIYYNENSVSDSRGVEKLPPILINRDAVNLGEYCKGYSVGVSPFLQIYTGHKVNGNSGVYNSMITYSTINNMYNNVALNRSIYNGIFNDELGNKNITNALIGLHMFKYEKSGSILSAKIDPLEKLTGKDAIARKSSKEYGYKSRMYTSRFKSNSLAEMRYLDKVLDLIEEKK